MNPFSYERATSFQAAAELLSQKGPGAKAMAGGTDLLGTLKDRIHPRSAQAVIDLKGIAGSDRIECDQDGLTLGALVRLKDLDLNPHIRKNYPLLAQAVQAVASPQIRNMGTLGGNLCQEPRCWYYRNPDNGFHCLRKGGQTCNAFDGENRFHSVFGAARIFQTSCRQACPGHIDIPRYFELLRDEDLEGAANVILAANPIPAITGRVCPHFCQQDCQRKDVDAAVSVQAVEQALGDYILAHGASFYQPPAEKIDRSVAVIGAGPAGLAAAYFLRRCGLRVVIFDKMPLAGGMLRYGIPSYRLPGNILDGQLAALKLMGIEFETGVEIGRHRSAGSLKEEFDALFMANGAWGRPAITLEGKEFALYGLDFLQNANGPDPKLPGRNIVVVGGGNVAVDVAISARRLGADTVTMVCLECEADMPAHSWELNEARAQGVDILPSWGPDRIKIDQGVVAGVDLICCTSVLDQNQCFAPCFDPSQNMHVAADAVILAVGQKVQPVRLEGLDVAPDGRISIDPQSGATSLKGVYAGGDAVYGAATVIEAVAAAKRSAQTICRDLGLTDAQFEPPGDNFKLKRFAHDCLSFQRRAIGRNEHPKKEKQPITEALNEAKRCFNCGCVAINSSDLAPALMALSATIETTRRKLAVEDFFTAAIGSTTILDPDELITQIHIPPGAANCPQAYLKFRLRRAIDFPIAGVAVWLRMDKDRVAEARIVLGAGAPVPIRARKAEEVLLGRILDEGVCALACDAAVVNALPLSHNRYKIDIFKALVKRALLTAAR